MNAGITPGPSGREAHQIIHYVYEKRDGSIISSYHLVGAEPSLRSNSALFLQETAKMGERTLEQLDVLTVSPHELPTGLSGPRQLYVDVATRKLVFRESTAIRHIRA